MTLLVTGGGGFVMAHVVRQWLEADPNRRALLVDQSPLDETARSFLEPLQSRLTTIEADVRDPALWRNLPDGIRHVVHGAAITPHSYIDEQGVRQGPERDDPLRVLEVNGMGAARALDWARRQASIERFVYVSTGAVYADDIPAGEDPEAPLTEDDHHLDPRGLYDITKFASERVTQRFVELYGLPASIVRLSGVFGPLDRITAARNVHCVPNRLVRAAVEGRPLRVTSAQASGDFIYAPDVAKALLALLRAPKTALRHAVYNIAYGQRVTVQELADAAAECIESFQLELTEAANAEVDQDPLRRNARYGAYDVARAEADFGWRPRPIREAVHDYVAWLRDNEY